MLNAMKEIDELRDITKRGPYLQVTGMNMRRRHGSLAITNKMLVRIAKMSYSVVLLFARNKDGLVDQSNY